MYSNKRAENLGREVSKLLFLKENKKGQVETGFGAKTMLGLGLTIEKILEDYDHKIESDKLAKEIEERIEKEKQSNIKAIELQKSIVATTLLLKSETDIDKRTEIMHNWMKNAHDGVRSLYKLNWRIAHSLFGISSRYFNSADIQNISFHKILKSEDCGKWEREL